ncbi:MAG: PspC domain-containing protein [Clostridium sp.]|jgi:phage shock protein PspC (stress-responsive transcriptional regulator)|nr:PspC domain-containing protein [Clostridium sp.]
MQKKLYRNTKEKMLSGVCAGLADYLNVDVTIVRLVVTMLSIFFGFVIGGLIVYAVCAVIIPAAPSEQVPPVQTQHYTPPYQPQQAPYQPPVAPPAPVQYQDISSSTPPET